jgi:C-terminal processing protease CtpA/Prc
MRKDESLRTSRRLAAAPLVLFAALLVAATPLCASAQNAQNLSSYDRERGRDMLAAIKEDIKKSYYDPTFHGIDLDAHFSAAGEKIKQATSLGQMFGVIAQALIDFDDSHLFFVPPGRTSRYDYGWRMQMVGDKCFITAVKPGSDAEAKGLQPGDEIYTVDGYGPTRENHWKMQYLYYSLRPRPGVRLVVNKPNGEQHQYDVLTKVTTGKKVKDLTDTIDLNNFLRDEEDDEQSRREGSRQVEVGADLLIWKLSSFDLTDAEVDDAMSKARKHKSLIIDLRGNGGGAETTLLRMLGNLFDHDVKLGDINRRKETKPLVAKTRGGDNIFKGNLVVLVDSESASASELFARTVQLEKRGTVVGDRSQGAVMRSRFHDHESGMDIVAFYGASVTDADIVMSDGKSLEHAGVLPDHWSLPTGADMAAHRDRVLSLAASIVGVEIEPEKAGTFFPLKWRK